MHYVVRVGNYFHVFFFLSLQCPKLLVGERAQTKVKIRDIKSRA